MRVKNWPKNPPNECDLFYMMDLDYVTPTGKQMSFSIPVFRDRIFKQLIVRYEIDDNILQCCGFSEQELTDSVNSAINKYYGDLYGNENAKI